MKLATHTATALMLSVFVLFFTPTNCLSYVNLILYGLSVYFSQIGIDTFGHTWVTYHGVRFPRRNRLHSLPGILLWGLIFGSPFLLSCPYLTVGVVLGMILHWLEDLVTEGGVYIGKKRIRLPFRVRYDNKFVNKGTILLFMFLSLAYFQLPPRILSESLYLQTYLLFALVYSLYAFLAV